MKLQEEYSNLHNTNQGLSDKAGTSNAHISFKDKLRLLKYKHFFDELGDDNVIRSHCCIRKTTGGYLSLGNRCTLDEYSTLLLTKPNPKLYIGDFVTIGRGSIISIKDTCYIGSYTLIGPFVQITDNNHSVARDNLIKYQRSSIKKVTIGEDCWIGSGAKILAGVSIGNGAVIGANAVVTHDIPAFAIAVGCPARVIKYRK